MWGNHKLPDSEGKTESESAEGVQFTAVRVYLTFKGNLLSCKSPCSDILSCYQVSL